VRKEREYASRGRPFSRLLASGGTLYLRELTPGIPAEEIREILSNAGYEEIRGSETRSRLAGPMFDARLRRE
jgi:hypothetical protein